MYGVQTEPDGLLYMRARYYDPEVGRFISEDPIGMDGGLNLYAYAANNPVMLTDPSGNCPWCFSAVVGAISGGYGSYIASGADWQSVIIGIGTGAAAGVINPVSTLGNLGLAFSSSIAGQVAGNAISGKSLGNINIGAAVGSAVVNPAARALGAAAATGAKAVYPRAISAFTSGAVTGIGEKTGANFVGDARASQGARRDGKGW